MLGEKWIVSESITRFCELILDQSVMASLNECFWYGAGTGTSSAYFGKSSARLVRMLRLLESVCAVTFALASFSGENYCSYYPGGRKWFQANVTKCQLQNTQPSCMRSDSYYKYYHEIPLGTQEISNFTLQSFEKNTTNKCNQTLAETCPDYKRLHHALFKPLQVKTTNLFNYLELCLNVLDFKDNQITWLSTKKGTYALLKHIRQKLGSNVLSQRMGFKQQALSSCCNITILKHAANDGANI